MPKDSRKFDYDLDYASLDLRASPEVYRVGVGEQGVLLVRPYKDEILPHWKFKTPAEAEISAKSILKLFRAYRKQRDLVGMDMARKFLQMGYTRARRYANHAGGRKYGPDGAVLPFQNDPVKAASAAIFKVAWARAEADPIYARLKKSLEDAPRVNTRTCDAAGLGSRLIVGFNFTRTQISSKEFPVNLRLNALTLTLALVAPCAFAEKELVGIDRAQLESSIESRSGVSHQTAVNIVNALADQFKVQPGQRLPISGYLFTHGFNFGLLRDSDTWFMNASVRDEAGNLIKAKELYQVYFQNGGFKYELAYKFMFVFLTADMSVKQLDGAVFGRGLGITFDMGVGMELAYMPGKNRAGAAVLVAPKVGFDGGVQLPRMTFHLRQVQP